MGLNLALNIASKGFPIAVCNRSAARVDAAAEKAQEQKLSDMVFPFKKIDEFVASLAKPRAVIILVNAGGPVDETIALLKGLMEPDDIIIDGGNEWWENTDRRGKDLAPTGIKYVGMGVSGGEEGARYGPSLMPGGPKEAYTLLEPILRKVAAQVDGHPCVTYIGPGGAGNYVKMVHNGIEYGDMQLIAEAYDLLKHVGGLTNAELASVFAEWNRAELQSFLIEITAQIFTVPDVRTGKGEAVDYVLDKTGMKGTGTWTVRDGAQQGVPIPTVAAALTARQLSGLLDERKRASALLTGPSLADAAKAVAAYSSPDAAGAAAGGAGSSGAGLTGKAALIADVRSALYAAKICSYAQGMALIKTTGDVNGWGLQLGGIARIWKGGCIIRARFLDSITQAFESDATLPNLLLHPTFTAAMSERQGALRRVTALSATSGISAPSFSASLAYYDMYRRAQLPANLTQAQRDFFGAHTFERTDASGPFHVEWGTLAKPLGKL